MLSSRGRRERARCCCVHVHELLPLVGDCESFSAVFPVRRRTSSEKETSRRMRRWDVSQSCLTFFHIVVVERRLCDVVDFPMYTTDKPTHTSERDRKKKPSADFLCVVVSLCIFILSRCEV